MDITWYGLSCFRIREGGVTIICDPYDRSVGLTLPKPRADIVTVSHQLLAELQADLADSQQARAELRVMAADDAALQARVDDLEAALARSRLRASLLPSGTGRHASRLS